VEATPAEEVPAEPIASNEAATEASNDETPTAE
jgi:hypothetical protein